MEGAGATVDEPSWADDTDAIPRRVWSRFQGKLKQPEGWQSEWFRMTKSEQLTTVLNYKKALDADVENGTKSEERAYWHSLRDQLHAFRRSRRERDRSRSPHTSQVRFCLNKKPCYNNYRERVLTNSFMRLLSPPVERPVSTSEHLSALRGLALPEDVFTLDSYLEEKTNASYQFLAGHCSNCTRSSWRQ